MSKKIPLQIETIRGIGVPRDWAQNGYRPSIYRDGKRGAALHLAQRQAAALTAYRLAWWDGDTGDSMVSDQQDEMACRLAVIEMERLGIA